MSPTQPDLFIQSPGPPDGFHYQPGLISEAEAQSLLAQITALTFQPFEFHGFFGKRQIVSFGYRYDFGGGRLRSVGALPDFLLTLRRQAGCFSGVAPESLVHTMITHYPPGAPIGWHRDRSVFGKVVGVSLLSAAPLRLRRRSATGFTRSKQVLEPCSVYLLDADARWIWEHSIPAQPLDRYSVTFRTLTSPAPADPAPLV